jgi:hypothetical protein
VTEPGATVPRPIRGLVRQPWNLAPNAASRLKGRRVGRPNGHHVPLGDQLHRRDKEKPQVTLRTADLKPPSGFRLSLYSLLPRFLGAIPIFATVENQIKRSGKLFSSGLKETRSDFSPEVRRLEVLAQQFQVVEQLALVLRQVPDHVQEMLKERQFGPSPGRSVSDTQQILLRD